MTSGALSSSLRSLHGTSSESRRSGHSKTALEGKRVSADDDVHRCMIRADVLRLHAVVTRSRGYGEAAGLQSDSPSVEEQLSKAAASATCGGLLELLLAKAMEAVSVTLQDMDEGSGAEKGFTSSLSLVGPLVTALDRLRLLHEKTRAGGRGMLQRKSSKTSVALSKGLTCDSAAQTDEVPSRRANVTKCKVASAEAVPTSGYPDEVSTPQSQSTAKQSGIAGVNSVQLHASSSPAEGGQTRRKDSVVDVGVQADLRLLPPEPPRRAAEVRSSRSDAGTQTSCRASPTGCSHASVQTSARDVALKSSFTQTEQGVANSTVRIVRMARAQRLGTPLAQSTPDLLKPSLIAEEKDSLNSTAFGADNVPAIRQESIAVSSGSSVPHLSDLSRDRSQSGSRDRQRGQRSRSKPSQSSTNSTVDGQRTASTATSLLRCPAGHGMQWIRSRRCSDSSDTSVTESLLQCDTCSAPIPSTAAFHSCAVCFRDTGERHAVCSACSQGMRAPEKSGSTWRTSLDSRGSNMSKSSSLGSLPLPDVPSPRVSHRARTKDMGVTASQWSLVSAMLPPTPCHAGLIDTALKQAMPRLH